MQNRSQLLLKLIEYTQQISLGITLWLMSSYLEQNICNMFAMERADVQFICFSLKAIYFIWYTYMCKLWRITHHYIHCPGIAYCPKHIQ